MYNSPYYGLPMANNIDEVRRSYGIGDTAYFSKDMSIVWIKNMKGEVRTYELKEIIEKDAKDLQIEVLQAQLEDYKRKVNEYESNDECFDEPIKDEKSSSIPSISRTKKKQWQSSRDFEQSYK